MVLFFRKAERPNWYFSWAAHNRAEPLRAEATRKWHCKPLKSLKMDSGSAARRRCFGFAEVRDETRSVGAWDRPSRPLRGAQSEVFEISQSGPRKWRKSAVKSLKSLTRVTLCAALAGKRQAKNAMGPGALRRNGALFRCSRNFWDVADDISAGERLAFASRRRKCSSAMFRTPFRSGIWSGDGRLTLSVQGQFFWSGGVMATPSFCRSLRDRAAFASPSRCLFMTTR